MPRLLRVTLDTNDHEILGSIVAFHSIAMVKVKISALPEG
jgi:hypothetical protein